MLSPENVPLENVFRMNKRGDGDYSLWTDIAAECSKQKKEAAVACTAASLREDTR